MFGMDVDKQMGKIVAAIEAGYQPIVPRRERLAKAAMTGILAAEDADLRLPSVREHVAALAVGLADALIAELDKR